jgi:PAT family beta-lactamase induction signal transducer AmpG
MKRNLLTALFLGINSGLIYALLGSTMTAYLTDMKIELVTIGFLTLRMMPYSLKYLWAPTVDSLKVDFFPAHFGQRKSWIISMQILLIMLIASLGFLDASLNLTAFFCMVLLTAFVAATYDIAMDAYRIELFKKAANSQGNSFVMLGWRIGLITSAAFGLYLSAFVSWKWVFMILAAFIFPCIAVVYFSEETRAFKSSPKTFRMKTWFKEHFVQPFKSFVKLPEFYMIILLIAFYKMSDGYLDAMLIPFLREIGFSKTEIATLSNATAIIASICGTFVGAYLFDKYNIIKVLFGAEVLAAATNLLFIILAHAGSIPELLVPIAFLESFCSGICNVVLICYMSSLCQHKFTATHYAILISISGFSRTLMSSSSGLVASCLGWEQFFIISTLLSIPSLICISYFLNKGTIVYRVKEAV